MKKNSITIFACLLIFAGCEKAGNDISYEGEAVFTSEMTATGETYLVYGFSFEKGKNIPFIYSNTTLPDVIVTNETDVGNNITGAVLNSPGNEKAFHLNGSFGSIGEAESFFNSYLEVKDSVWHTLAEHLQRNQVWTIQTKDKNYAKILIREIIVMTDSQVSDYVNIKVRYKYQPDGSHSFADK